VSRVEPTGIANSELAIRRIRQRVKTGDHTVPDADVKRRLTRSLSDFVETDAPLADAWTFRDNSTQSPSLLFDSVSSTRLQVKPLLRQ
jgi:predicted ABC-type ATPase